MTVFTKFNIGQRIIHSENGIGYIESIHISADKMSTDISYSVVHRKEDNLDSDFASDYYENEILAVE